jgi:cell division protein FtsN
MSKKLQLIIFLLILTSCTNDNNPQLRFVDLKGKTRPVKFRVPEQNAQILNQKYSPNQAFTKPTVSTNNQQIATQQNISEQNPYTKVRAELEKNEKQSDNNIDYGNNQQPNQKIYEQEKSYDFAQSASDAIVTNTQQKRSIESLPQEDSVRFINNEPKTIVKNNKNESVKKNKIVAAKPATENSKYSQQNQQPDNKTKPVQIDKAVKPKLGSAIAVDVTEKQSHKIIEIPSSSPSTKDFYIQLGSFSSKINADKLVRQSNYNNTIMIAANVDGSIVYRVLVGPYQNQKAAQKEMQKIKKSGKAAVITKN